MREGTQMTNRDEGDFSDGLVSRYAASPFPSPSAAQWRHGW